MSPLREFVEGVTFREFRAMAAARAWTVERVLERIGPNAFGGPASSPFYESPRAYLERVLRRAHTRDDELVIPYRCLIRLYVEETRLTRAIPDRVRRCDCGCGSPVYGRARYAAGACRMRTQRVRRDLPGTDPQNGPEKVA